MTQKDTVFLALLALLAVLVYANSLRGEFIYDDYVYVLDNRQVDGEDSLFSNPTPSDRPVLGLYRPLVILTYRLNWQWGGYQPFLFHGTNVLLHLMVTIAVYFLVRTIAHNRAGAFLAGMLFAVHPVHGEAVAWIVGRAEIMAALFCLLTALFHLASRRRVWLLFPAALAFLAACLSKENAFAFPLILVMADMFFVEKGQRAQAGSQADCSANRPHLLKRLRPAAYGTYLLVIAVVVGLRYMVLEAFGPSGGPTPYGELDLLERIPVSFSILAESLRLMVFPSGMRIFYHASEFREVTFTGMGLLALYVLLLMFLAWKRSPVLFWLLWIPMSLITVLNIVPIGAAFAERFLYLPSVGACAAAGLGLAHLCGWLSPRRGIRSAAWVPVMLVLALGFLTWLRNPVYHDAVSLWEDAVSKADYAFTHYNLGESYYEKGYVDYLSPEKQGALVELKKSLEMDPDHLYAFAAHFTLGRYYLEPPRRDYPRAAVYFRAAAKDPEMIERFPRILEAYATLVQIALQTGGTIVGMDEALEYLDVLDRWGFHPEDMVLLREEIEKLKEDDAK